MFNSLKNRLLAWFVLIALAVGCAVFPLNYFHNKGELAIRNSVYTLNDLHIQFVNDLRYSSEFLSYEINNPDFFISGESPFLTKHNLLADTIGVLLSANSVLEKKLFTVNESLLKNLSVHYPLYCKQLDSLVYTIYKRGYRDFGLEGEMISYIYEIEKNKKLLPATYEIRKYEREYLNRNDTALVPVFNALVDHLILSVSISNSFKLDEKAALVTQLKKYRKSFNQLVELDTKMGLRTNTGLKAALNQIGVIIDNEIQQGIIDARAYERYQMARLNTIFAILALLLLAGAVLLSRYISNHLSVQFEQLADYIGKITETGVGHTEKLNLRHSSTEIRKIYKEFRNMVAQLKIREAQRDRAIISAKENEQRYRDLADLLPQSIFETDRIGNLIYVNKAWYQNFGYTTEDLESGLNLIEILNTDNSAALFATDKIENSDYLAIRKNGTKFPASVYSDTISEEGNQIGRRGIIIDATLRNQYIEALKKETVKAITSDKHKSSFLANMSHEIRTPMNSILGFANLLSTPQVPDLQKKDFIQYIQSSGQILLNLIDDIIDIAKIEAGEIKIKQGKCAPANIIKDVCNTFEGYKASIGKQDLKLELQLPKEEIWAKTDSFRLKQILSNLISNAIKFTEQGSITIKLSVKNNRVLEFMVEDTGIGLTKDELNSIFERFKRSKTSESKNISGTGLGLAISKNLVELLGGQMWVSSEPGVGTRFWFEIPYLRIASELPSEILIDTTEQENRYNWQRQTILVAEDDDTSYALLKEMLAKTNARLVRAVNGREVVEAVKISDDIHLILMDIQMPYLNGYEATKQIKLLKPSLPIIAQTAFAMEGDKEKSILAGCDDYLTKPLNPLKMLAKISQFLDITTISNSNVKESTNHKQPSDSIKKLH